MLHVAMQEWHTGGDLKSILTTYTVLVITYDRTYNNSGSANPKFGKSILTYCLDEFQILKSGKHAYQKSSLFV